VTVHMTLTSTVKKFIVRCCACGDTPSEIVKKVAEEFAVKVTPQTCMKYDPRTVSGSTLSAPLRELFAVTREKFLSELEAIDGAHREIRLRRLDALYAAAMKSGQLKIAIAAIAEARKTMADLMEVDTPTEES
jgi:hypothetical protein